MDVTYALKVKYTRSHVPRTTLSDERVAAVKQLAAAQPKVEENRKSPVVQVVKSLHHRSDLFIL